MNKLRVFLYIALTLAAMPALAQYTSVSAQIVDANGNLYTTANYSFDLNVPANAVSQPVLGTYGVFPRHVDGFSDSGGNMAVTLADNNQITPAGTTWRLSICASDGTHCFTLSSLTITGTSQSLTSAITAVAPLLGPGAAFNAQGAWSGTTTYHKNDLVTYQGSSYVALTTNNNVVPGTDATKWQLLASVGATGATGATGAQGQQGNAGIAGPGGGIGSTNAVADCGVPVNGGVDIATTLTSCETNHPGATILFPQGTYTVGTSHTAASGITYDVVGGTNFSVASGKNLTLNLAKNVNCSIGQIFSGAGTKRVTSGDVCVEWYGAVGNGTTDDSAAIQEAISDNAALTGHAAAPHIHFMKHQSSSSSTALYEIDYYLGSSLSVNTPGIYFDCVGGSGVAAITGPGTCGFLFADGLANGIHVGQNAYGWHAQDMTLYNKRGGELPNAFLPDPWMLVNGATSDGWYIESVGTGARLGAFFWPRYGFYFDGGSGGNNIGSHFTSLEGTYNQYSGMRLNGSNTQSLLFENTDWHNNGHWAVNTGDNAGQFNVLVNTIAHGNGRWDGGTPASTVNISSISCDGATHGTLVAASSSFPGNFAAATPILGNILTIAGTTNTWGASTYPYTTSKGQIILTGITNPTTYTFTCSLGNVSEATGTARFATGNEFFYTLSQQVSANYTGSGSYRGGAGTMWVGRYSESTNGDPNTGLCIIDKGDVVINDTPGCSYDVANSTDGSIYGLDTLYLPASGNATYKVSHPVDHSLTWQLQNGATGDGYGNAICFLGHTSNALECMGMDTAVSTFANPGDFKIVVGSNYRFLLGNGNNVNDVWLNANPGTAGIVKLNWTSSQSGTGGACIGNGSGHCNGDLQAGTLSNDGNNKAGVPTSIPASGATVGITVATGTATLGSSAISAGTCATVVTVASTNVATTDVIAWAYSTAPTAASDGMLIVQPYPTAGNVNFLLCNPTAGSITPTGKTINWRVAR